MQLVKKKMATSIHVIIKKNGYMGPCDYSKNGYMDPCDYEKNGYVDPCD